MIPALPEKDDDKVTSARQPAAEAKVPQPAPGARLSDMYERDVINFVGNQLDSGLAEDAIVESLLPHDFSRSEAQRLVREMASERGRARVGRRKRIVDQNADEEISHQLEAIVAAHREAARKDMAFGAMWFLGGLFLTLVTFAMRAGAGGVLFWGAMVWGAVQFLRGMATYGSSGPR